MRWTASTAAVAMVLTVAACGGRIANPVALETAIDGRLDCGQIAAERSFIVKRIADLEDERNFNRARTLSRVPGALIGSPISAIVFADLSLAIYEEIAALEERDKRLAGLQAEKECDAVVNRTLAQDRVLGPSGEIAADQYGAGAANGDGG